MLNQRLQSRPLIISTILGLLLIPFLYLINSYSPLPEKAPSDYNSVILAFEFVSNDAELKEVLDPLTTEEISDIDQLNKVDFGFMIMYGLFLISVIIKFRKLHHHDWLKYTAILTMIAVIADLLENLQLLSLSNAYKQGIMDHQETIDRLALFTWSKWILLALVIAQLGYSIIMSNRYKWVGYSLFIPIVLGTSAISMKTPIIEDTFGTSIFLCFFIIWILSLFYKKR